MTLILCFEEIAVKDNSGGDQPAIAKTLIACCNTYVWFRTLKLIRPSLWSKREIRLCDL